MKKIAYIMLAIIVILVIFIGCNLLFDFSGNAPTPSENPNVSQENENTTKDVTLYFASDIANSLEAEKRTLDIKEDINIYKLTVEELIKGPENKKLANAVHVNTLVNDVSVDGKVATVDFNHTLKKYNTGGSTKELLCIYAIVNTLCDFDEIDKVVITLDGKQLETFGQYDMTEPFSKNEDIITKK